MPININDGPNAVVAKATVSFVSAGINSTNTEIIFLVDNSLLSFKPGRAINGISGFEVNKGYYIVAKQDMDLSTILVPPLTDLTQLGTPGNFTATPISSSQINLDWDAVANATSYVVDRATNSGFTTGVSLAIFSGSATAFNDTGLTAATHYYYRVRAVASGFIDSAYATADATAGVIAGDQAAGTDLTFATRDVNMTLASKILSTSSTGNTWTNCGLDALKSAAGSASRVHAYFDGSFMAMIGFDPTNAKPSSWTEIYASINIQGGYDDHIVLASNGDAWDTGVTAISGRWYGLYRQSDGVMKIQESIDGTNWSDVYNATTTHFVSSAAELFVVCALNGSGAIPAGTFLKYPKGNNLI